MISFTKSSLLCQNQNSTIWYSKEICRNRPVPHLHVNKLKAVIRRWLRLFWFLKSLIGNIHPILFLVHLRHRYWGCKVATTLYLAANEMAFSVLKILIIMALAKLMILNIPEMIMSLDNKFYCKVLLFTFLLICGSSKWTQKENC